jgi:DNA-binding NtrC family response regulator
LYHRLAVVPIHVPSLSERASDVPVLVAHFLDMLCRQSGRSVPKVSAEAMDMLAKAPWTGNVRELRNAVERLLIFCQAKGAIDAALVAKHGHLA